MAKAVVLLFLLDSLPDFNDVVTTLHKITPGMIVTCDTTLAAPVLEVIGKKLNLSADSMEKLQNNELSNHNPSYKLQELSPETFNNVDLHDNSFHESFEFSDETMNTNFIEHNYIGNENKDINELPSVSNKTANEYTNASEVSYPESAPFLAAIFETVGNVTAQTCGGVVLSKYWVLTAASCVNVLGPIYSNSSKESPDTSYSIVVGATNPLKDGSVHQVSKIYLHPTNNQSHSPAQELMKDWFSSLGAENVSFPSLALLRIQPGVEGGMLQMAENMTGWTGEAMFYGWALEHQDSGYATTVTSMPAKQLRPGECKKIYGIPENDAMLCLSANETSTNTTRILSGCPLVALRGGSLGLLAVALTDTRPLLASPLSAHRDWLHTLTAVEN